MVIRTLTEALQNVANKELNEDPARIDINLHEFRTWIEQQPHLKARNEDQFLIAFLRNCKYNLEEAKLKLDNYYALKEKYPEFLKRPNIDDEKFRKLLKCGIVLYLSKPLTESGPRVCLVSNGAYDPAVHTFGEVSQLRQLIQDIIFLEDDLAVVGGLVYVMDFGEVSKSHFFQVGPGTVRKISQYSEQAIPLNITATHFIDTTMGFEPLYNLVRPFMSDKVKNKMYVHGSKREELFKIIPKEILPHEYGGEDGSLQQLIDYWEQKILSYAEYFKEDEQFGVDESLRIKNSNESSGLVGSFRKLFN